MFIIEIVIFLFAGLLAGGFAGLLGIGGGIIFVPVQILIYNLTGMSKEIQMKTAVATSLATIIFTTISSARAHSKRKAIEWDIVYKIVVGILLGAIGGTILARAIPGKVLEIIFGLFLFLVSLYLFFVKSLKEHPENRIPNFPIMNSIAFVIGAFSAMMGVGGGLIMVPTLVHFHVPIRQAIGTSSVIGFVLSLFGAIAYIIPSFHGGVYPPYSIGYIYLPALIPMAIGAVIAAPFGAYLTHTLPRELIRKIFAGFVFLVAVLMIFR